MRISSKAKGRITLAIEGIRIGPDYLATLTGGEAHIGAVALAEPAGEPGLITAHGHREGELALRLANTLATALSCRVAVVCGIHYDRISREEITLVLETAHILAGQLGFMENLMLKMAELEKFEQALKDGQIEDIFRYGSEEQRLEILALLEKVMDIGELADQVATRILMPNIAGKAVSEPK